MSVGTLKETPEQSGLNISKYHQLNTLSATTPNSHIQLSWSWTEIQFTGLSCFKCNLATIFLLSLELSFRILLQFQYIKALLNKCKHKETSCRWLPKMPRLKFSWYHDFRKGGRENSKMEKPPSWKQGNRMVLGGREGSPRGEETTGVQGDWSEAKRWR